MKELSENLKRLRESRKVSKSELARLLNIAPSAYSVYETGLKEVGDREPTLTNLIKLAYFFNVSVDELLNYHIDEYKRCKNLWESAGFKISTEEKYIDEKIFQDLTKVYCFDADDLKDFTGKIFFIKVTGFSEHNISIEFCCKRDFIEHTKQMEQKFYEKSVEYFRDFAEIAGKFSNVPRVIRGTFKIPHIK